MVHYMQDVKDLEILSKFRKKGLFLESLNFLWILFSCYVIKSPWKNVDNPLCIYCNGLAPLNGYGISARETHTKIYEKIINAESCLGK